MLKKIFLIFYDFGMGLKRDNISAYASSTAFFFFLSIAPMLLVISAIITYTPVTEEMLTKMSESMLPEIVAPYAADFINQMYNLSHAVLPIAIIVALWSAGKGFMGLQMGLNVAHGVVETRNFFIIRLQASFYTLITLLAVLMTFVLSLLTRNVASFIGYHFPALINLAEFFHSYRFILGWAILTVLFTLIYTFIPNMKLKLMYQIPGAMVSAVGWQLYSWGFSLYLQYVGGLSTYGSLSVIIVVMFWLYFSMFLLLIGANLNKYFYPVIKVLFRRN